jgi:hypothetical protein
LIFIIITILSWLALVLGLSWYEYKGLNQEDREKKGSYFSWLFSKKTRFNPMFWKKQGLEFYNRRFVQAYPLKQRWIFVCLALSFLYLGLSGFIFALVLPGRIRGILLMLHMIAGGVFGMTLGVVVVLRARFHNLVDIDTPLTRSDIDHFLVRITFWIFVLSGLFLIISALAMMMPFFSLSAQIQIFSLHQYSALVSVLAAFAFIYLTPEIHSGDQPIK